MAEQKKNFIDFITKAKKSKALTKGFLEAETSKELKTFFVKKGFEKISLTECEKLIYYKKHLPDDIKKIIDEKGMY